MKQQDNNGFGSLARGFVTMWFIWTLVSFGIAVGVVLIILHFLEKYW